MKTFGIHVKNVTNHLIEKLQVHVKSAHENIWHLCVKCDKSFARHICHDKRKVPAIITRVC